MDVTNAVLAPSPDQWLWLRNVWVPQHYLYAAVQDNAWRALKANPVFALQQCKPGSGAPQPASTDPTCYAVVHPAAPTGSTGATGATGSTGATGATAPAPTPAPSTNPSGVAAPVGDIAGWRQIFVDDFTTDVPLGSFPSISMPSPAGCPADVSAKWRTTYPDGWKDTSKAGTYSPLKTLSVSGSVLRMHLHTDGGTVCVAAPVPNIPGEVQTYGRYAIRFKVPAPIPGYKTAWLLWPKSENWPNDGEIDFPEGGLDGTISAFMHRQGGTSGGDQDAYSTSTHYADGNWHTAVTEWGPDACAFYIDGTVVGRSTSRIPSTAMRYVIQTETNGGAPDPSVAGDVLIDWVAIWAKA